MIAAYRDMVEGGKPQLLFYIKAKKNKEQIEKRFKNKMKQKKNKFMAGKKLLWIPTKELKSMYIAPDRILYNGKKYRMMPSASASIVMLLNYLEKG